MTTIDCLRAARALIADRNHWCQGNLHRTAIVVGPAGYKQVTQYCSVGALRAIGMTAKPDPAVWCAATDALLDALRATSGCRSVEGFNDVHSHASVLALWDRAIADEQAKLDAEAARRMWEELRALECPEVLAEAVR